MITPTETVVCDIGAGSIKIGFAGSLVPEQVVPSTMACPRFGPSDEQPVLIGSAALKTKDRKKHKNHWPIDENGAVQDWDCLERLLRFALQGIERDCSNYSILITRPYNMSRQDMKQLMDLLFHGFGFAKVNMHDQAALVLYTQGVESGLVVEMGEGMVNVVPVYKGHAIPDLNKRMTVGGRSVSLNLIKLLRLRGYHTDAREDLDIGRAITEQACYVALDPSIETRLAEETTILEEPFKLHDGTTYRLGKERFQAPEALFQPKLVGSEGSGLVDLIFNTVQEVGIDCRVDLYQNIILSGGLSTLPGLQERLERDLNSVYRKRVLNGDDSRLPRNWKIQVHAPDSRKYSVYEGAALFADFISKETRLWTTKSEYCRSGVQALLDKCQVS